MKSWTNGTHFRTLRHSGGLRPNSGPKATRVRLIKSTSFAISNSRRDLFVVTTKASETWSGRSTPTDRRHSRGRRLRISSHAFSARPFRPTAMECLSAYSLRRSHGVKKQSTFMREIGPTSGSKLRRGGDGGRDSSVNGLICVSTCSLASSPLSS